MSEPDTSLTRDDVRDVDRRAIEELGMPGVVLMENAGRETARVFRKGGLDGEVVICCGKGNNGGDGYVIARHLEIEGVAVRTLVFAEPDDITGDAEVNLRVLQQSGANVEFLPEPDSDDLEQRLADADWIVDALLGTGVRGELREPLPAVIASINAAPGQVGAVDLPSGMDCDTGERLGECVRAERTATFVARKRGFDAPGTAEWTGDVHVVSIGVPRSLLTSYGLR
ncbi:Bifunctional NAD(P)H-hydrate repair enzyme Nnr [Maioricimonas rarisocia]|uniref:NAD(P)H-hydrate epimerase n=1 Tax=Maioricimonas rarisocia TaxID=2528026 RepID=A0A517ZDK9_9PLAN|nr:NAD(P)H-hydrate epimerase [Maioricimonas rarisocia]QDU40564.1 Bifunctional NAD(P)H-hydrate repair enzyme Nnr [Maioricimonas rarisocia]